MFSFAPSGALTLAFLLCGIHTASCALVDDWRSRSIYQIVTDRFAAGEHSPNSAMVADGPGCDTVLGNYCGGTWRGIMEQLDYIQGMNFDAIWISPIVAQMPQSTIDGTSFGGYWQQDLYGLNSKFGSAEDLHELIDAVHNRSMYLMLDVVVNHMAYAGAVKDIDYSIFNPFNDPKYFHPHCEIDYSNLTSLQDCWLGDDNVPLADLNTQSPEVQRMWGEWAEQMVANYSIDGLRIDAGANVQPDFFTGFVKSAGVFATAEVYLGNETEACRWQDTVGSILNYPLLWPMTAAFQPKGNFTGLIEMIESEQKVCKDTTALGTFSEV